MNLIMFLRCVLFVYYLERSGFLFLGCFKKGGINYEMCCVGKDNVK